jgi:hypothetical protein
MSWATDDGWEDGSGSIISSETGFAHTGSIVNYQRCNFVVTHDDLSFIVCSLNSNKI